VGLSAGARPMRFASLPVIEKSNEEVRPG